MVIEETAGFSNREEEKDEAVGSSGRRKEKKEEATDCNGESPKKEDHAASSKGSREVKKENLAAPKAVAMDLETAKDMESEDDYGVHLRIQVHSCPKLSTQRTVGTKKKG